MKSASMVFLLICASQNAHALKPASKEELAELNEIFVTIKAVQKKIELIEEAREKAPPNKIAELDRKRISLMQERETPCRQALWLTMKAYGLLPFDGDRPILPKGVSFLRSPQIGKEITWIPVFEEKRTYELQNAVGRTAYKNVQLPETAGNTASDGVSRIFPDAFTSPASLAARIYHERVHFEQFTTPKLASIKTPAELEVHAYSKEKIVWRNNLLGMTSDELELEDEYLTDNLAKYEAKAAIQRAKVKKAKGLPIDEYSIKSLPEDQLAGLVDQARKQLGIAHRDHDERLKNNMGALTYRSCANPGSVSQEELNDLPQPYEDSFYLGKIPSGVGDCSSIYFYLAQGGRDAEALRRMSTPPAAVQPVPPPAQPIPLNPSFPSLTPRFSTIFPQLKDFAIAACRDLKQVPRMHPLYRTYDISHAADEDNLARNLTADMGSCSRQLFHKMIEKTRAKEGQFSLTSEWVKDMVAAYTPGTGTSPGYVDPSPAPPSRGRRCEDFGVINCPKNLLQVKL